MTVSQTSVPGKVMITGEYSVLQGHPALAVTVDKRLTAQASPRETGFELSTNIWESRHTFPSLNLDSKDIFHSTCAWAQKQWNLNSFAIAVSSDIAVRDGIGSSSALRLACLAALQDLQQEPRLSHEELAKLAWQRQREQQGFASGYDVATQLVGGLVKFVSDQWDWSWEKYAWNRLQDVVHIYAGGKGAPTDKVGGSTLSWLQEQDLFLDLITISNHLVTKLVAFNHAGCNFSEIVTLTSQHRNIFIRNLNFPNKVYQALYELPGFDQNWSFKTTGAGGEDSILIIHPGPPDEMINHKLAKLGWFPAPFKPDNQGLKSIRGDLY